MGYRQIGGTKEAPGGVLFLVGEQGEVKWLLTTNENLHKISFLLGLGYDIRRSIKHLLIKFP